MDVVHHADDTGPLLAFLCRRSTQIDSLAKRAFSRPVRTRDRLRDDDNRGLALAVQTIEHAALDELDTQRVEIAGRHLLGHEHRRHLAVGQRPALDAVPRAGQFATEGHGGRRRRRDGAGQAAQAVDYLTMEIQARVRGVVVALRERESEGQHAGRVEAGIDRRKPLERSDRQPRPD